MFNKLIKGLKKEDIEKRRAEVVRIEEIIKKVAIFFDEEKVTPNEMSIILKIWQGHFDKHQINERLTKG